MSLCTDRDMNDYNFVGTHIHPHICNFYTYIYIYIYMYTDARKTHTHTQIYIYIYIYICHPTSKIYAFLLFAAFLRLRQSTNDVRPRATADVYIHATSPKYQ